MPFKSVIRSYPCAEALHKLWESSQKILSSKGFALTSDEAHMAFFAKRADETGASGSSHEGTYSPECSFKRFEVWMNAHEHLNLSPSMFDSSLSNALTELCKPLKALKRLFG